MPKGEVIQIRELRGVAGDRVIGLVGRHAFDRAVSYADANAAPLLTTDPASRIVRRVFRSREGEVGSGLPEE